MLISNHSWVYVIIFWMANQETCWFRNITLNVLQDMNFKADILYRVTKRKERKDIECRVVRQSLKKHDRWWETRGNWTHDKGYEQEDNISCCNTEMEELFTPYKKNQIGQIFCVISFPKLRTTLTVGTTSSWRMERSLGTTSSWMECSLGLLLNKRGIRINT